MVELHSHVIFCCCIHFYLTYTGISFKYFKNSTTTYLMGQCVKTMEIFLEFLQITLLLLCTQSHPPSFFWNRKYIFWTDVVSNTKTRKKNSWEFKSCPVEPTFILFKTLYIQIGLLLLKPSDQDPQCFPLCLTTHAYNCKASGKPFTPWWRLLTPLKYYVSENIMENRAYNAPFSIIFPKVFNTLLNFFLQFFQCCLKIENDVMV